MYKQAYFQYFIISKTNFIILINKQAIDKVKYVKYLGVLIDSQLSFKFHIGVLYKLRHHVTTKILIDVYYGIIYPFLLYGITIWDSSSKTLLAPLLILQKIFVRLATYNDTYPVIPGLLTHTSPLFQKLKLLNIFDIYKLQLGKLV